MEYAQMPEASQASRQRQLANFCRYRRDLFDVFVEQEQVVLKLDVAEFSGVNVKS